MNNVEKSSKTQRGKTKSILKRAKSKHKKKAHEKSQEQEITEPPMDFKLLKTVT